MHASLAFVATILANLSVAADLPRSRPEEQGVESAGILAFVQDADQKIDSLHSVMIVRHGHVVAEGWWAPYAASSPHMLFSLSKSFTSTAVGLAIAEGKLRLDDPVLKFFPEDAPANPNANLKAMRVSDLLRMSTGQQTEPQRTPKEPWTKTFLAAAVPFKPGTHFLYNTSATYMCSAIVQKATGQTLLDYLKPRLFDPLGITNATWETSPQGISTGGYGLSVRTEDIAKFGQLYLQKGHWNGKQLVPETWVAEATARQTSNGSAPSSDWDQGYGYQFWRCRHNAYRGDGAFGQFCIVLPEQDAVIAITSGLRDMQAVLNLVWDKLLPAMKPSALPANTDLQAKLTRTLRGLSIRTPKNVTNGPEVYGKKYVLASNDAKQESLTLEHDPNGGFVTLATRVNGKDYRIDCGKEVWRQSEAAWGGMGARPVAAAGGWTDAEMFTAKLVFYETPFVTTLKLKFSGNEVRVETESNVGFGRTRQPTLVGKAQ